MQEQAIQEERPFHRALDDAYYTGRILLFWTWNGMASTCRWIITACPGAGRRNSACIFQIIQNTSPGPLRKGGYHEGQELTDMVCLRCGRMLRKKVRWFPWGQKLYLCLAVCPEHGYIERKNAAEEVGVRSILWSEDDKGGLGGGRRAASPETGGREEKKKREEGYSSRIR